MSNLHAIMSLHDAEPSARPTPRAGSMSSSGEEVGDNLQDMVAEIMWSSSLLAVIGTGDCLSEL